MDESSPAFDLPPLYRDVLDGIARLERVGERTAAAKIRRDAIRTYSDRWDARGRKRMQRLVEDCNRLLRDHPQADRLAALYASGETV